MKSVMDRTATALNASLGQCPRCMRQSFLFALGAWGAAIILNVAQAGFGLASLSLMIASGLTVLWLCHVTAFALRSARHAHGAMRNSKDITTSHDSSVEPRRRFMVTFAKSVVFVISATALPFSTAYAQTCPCEDPTPKCCWSYDAQYYVCAPEDAVCCGHPNNPWFCGSNENCTGDGSTLPKCR